MPFPIPTVALVPCPIPTAVAASYPILTTIVVAIPLPTTALPLLLLRRRFLLVYGFCHDSLPSSSMVAVAASASPLPLMVVAAGTLPPRGSRSSFHGASRGLWRCAEHGCDALDAIDRVPSGRLLRAIGELYID
jgi:hypothetical protein